MMMTIMIRYSGDDDDGDNYDNIQVTMIRYSGDGPLLGSSAKSSSFIPASGRFLKRHQYLHDQIVLFQPLFLKLILNISFEYFRPNRALFKN